METPDGNVHFSGVLADEELEVVISVGLATLLSHGALPFLNSKGRDGEAKNIVFPISTQSQ